MSFTPTPVQIFIAYSRRDQEFLQELRSHLTPLERAGRVKIWYDGHIEAGQEWEAVIRQGLSNADIILLLLSANSISSDYFYGKEVTASLERHARGEARVVPLILAPCLWYETPLAELQALPKDGLPVEEWPSRTKAWHDAVASLSQLVREINARRQEVWEAEERRHTTEATERYRQEAAERQRREAEAAHAAREEAEEQRRREAEKTIRQQREQEAEAERYRQRTLEAAFAEALNLAQQYRDAGNHKMAVRQLKVALKLKPEDPQALAMKSLYTGVAQQMETQLARNLLRGVAAVAAGVLFWWVLSYVWKKKPAAHSSATLSELNQPASGMPSSTFTDPFADQMVRVEGGTFTMGCSKKTDTDCQDDEQPAHPVTLDAFAIGKYEVTQAQWRAVMGANPSHFQNCAQCPVEQVSWDDVQRFIEKLNRLTGKNYRLPTEAEWEYAARGGQGSKNYRYAGGNELKKVAWFDSNSNSKTHPVGQKQPNELELFDMSGNVWEWCADRYGPYASTAQHNPTGPNAGTGRVLRGGAWFDYITEDCRVKSRAYVAHFFRIHKFGFRLAQGL